MMTLVALRSTRPEDPSHRRRKGLAIGIA